MLHSAIGTEALEASQAKQASSVIETVFTGVKNMLHKGMSMTNLISDNYIFNVDVSGVNVVITEHSILVPMETDEGTALIVLDKDTATAETVLDTLFKGKVAKGAAPESMANKIIEAIKSMKGNHLENADLVTDIASASLEQDSFLDKLKAKASESVAAVKKMVAGTTEELSAKDDSKLE